jgi:hypothetical protein
MDIAEAIPKVRSSIAAVLRLHTVKPAAMHKGKQRPAQIQASISGTAFCIVTDKYLVTAYHVLNGGKPRDTNDKFYAFIVPSNSDHAHHFTIVGFPIEKAEHDIVVLEIGPCSNKEIHIENLPITFANQADGIRIITMGFPAPEIAAVNLDKDGNYVGGQFFLKSHANEGIISAQYNMSGLHMYELNVGWHHGESGGPIVIPNDPPQAFSIMQHYRNVTTPHGVVAGPHRGCSLEGIQKEIIELGAQVVNLAV